MFFKMILFFNNEEVRPCSKYNFRVSSINNFLWREITWNLYKRHLVPTYIYYMLMPGNSGNDTNDWSKTWNPMHVSQSRDLPAFVVNVLKYLAHIEYLLDSELASATETSQKFQWNERRSNFI